jgi:hypothetical protein
LENRKIGKWENWKIEKPQNRKIGKSKIENGKMRRMVGSGEEG